MTDSSKSLVSAPDALVAASLSAAPWHLAASKIEGDAPNRRKFRSYPIGYFHIDIAETRSAKGRTFLRIQFSLAGCAPTTNGGASCIVRKLNFWVFPSRKAAGSAWRCSLPG